MINFDDETGENIKEHNQTWPQIPDHPYRILLICSSGSGRSHELNIDQIYLYAHDPYKAKYHLLINKR